jgi:hypothetical protein
VIKLIVRWQKYAKRGIDILRLPQGTLEHTIDYGLADIFVAADCCLAHISALGGLN